MKAARLLRALILAVPCEVHWVPTDHGTRCTPRKQDIRDVRHITIWVRRVTWRRKPRVVSSGTSGRKPLAQSCARTVASVLSALMRASAISRTWRGLAITPRPMCGRITSATALAVPVAATTTWPARVRFCANAAP